MKKHILPCLIAVFIGGCFAAAPALTNTPNEESRQAAVVMSLTDVNTDDRIYFSCIPMVATTKADRSVVPNLTNEVP